MKPNLDSAPRSTRGCPPRQQRRRDWTSPKRQKAQILVKEKISNIWLLTPLMSGVDGTISRDLYTLPGLTGGKWWADPHTVPAGDVWAGFDPVSVTPVKCQLISWACTDTTHIANIWLCRIICLSVCSWVTLTRPLTLDVHHSSFFAQEKDTPAAETSSGIPVTLFL